MNSLTAEVGDIVLFKDGMFFYVDTIRLKGWSGYELGKPDKPFFRSFYDGVHLVYKGYTPAEIEQMDEILDRMLDEETLQQMKKGKYDG